MEKKLNKIKFVLEMEENLLTQSIIAVDENISALNSMLLILASSLHLMLIKCSLCWVLSIAGS